MVTKEIQDKIKLNVLTLLNEQFMYSDEIIEKCIESLGTQIKSSNPKLTVKNQLKSLSDDKFIAYYHGYKITPKGKSLLIKFLIPNNHLH